MKIKILLSCLTMLTLLSVSHVIAQTDEYYRPDTLGKERPQRKEIPPVEKQEVAEQKKVLDFKQQPFVDRLRLGGSFGLSFGSVTNVNLSPMAGYELTEKLVAGVGLTGMYFRSKYYAINSLYYGGRGFVMYNAFPMVNLIGELEGMNVEASYQKRKWLASPMLGASYSQPIGARFIKAVHLTVLYNLSYNNQIDPNNQQNISPYSSPFVFRVTFL
jgi:hypothetical protein